MGRLAYTLSPKYRQRLMENLTQAVGPERAQALKREAIRESGKQALELVWVWLRPLDSLMAHIRQAEGYALLKEAKGGVLVLTPHLGCFELLSLYGAVDSQRPVTVLYRRPKRIAWDPLVRKGRARGGVELATADASGVRSMVKTLREGNAVGMLPDQVPAQGEGIWASFFGRMAWTMTLAARLSEMKGVTVLVAWSERLPAGKGFSLHMEVPKVALSGDVAARTQQINALLEDLILRNPTQYLWGYHRYKRPKGVPPRPEDGPHQTDEALP